MLRVATTRSNCASSVQMTVFNLRSRAVNIGSRWNSTAGSRHSIEDDAGPSWPSNPCPNPYEIFGMKKSEFSKQKARKIFYRMAKIYHPDVAADHIGNLTRQMRADRFRKLNEAYEILKSDSKRRTLDAKLAMERNRARGTMYHYHHQHAQTRPTATYASASYNDFYHRGEYEGYEEEAQSRSSDAQFQESLKKSRKKIFILLSAAVGAISILELIAVFQLTEQAQARREHESYLAEVANMRAQSNYGLGLESEDRVSRFLNVRSSSGYYDNYGIDNFSPSLSLVDTRRKSSSD